MKKNKLSLTLPLAITFVLMVVAVVYISSLFYRISVANIYEVGSDKISGISASLGNYLDTTKSVLWVTADTVDFMVSKGQSNEEILDYLMVATKKHKSQFDENYTGLYGCIAGEYLDGLGWVPPDDYDPTKRDWYRITKAAGGSLVIVPPYVDAQTGSMVISVCKLLSNGSDVVALDDYTTHIQEIISQTNINGKGYGFIVDKNGTIIAHADTARNGMDCHTLPGGAVLMEKLEHEETNFQAEIDGKPCTVFKKAVMDQWYMVIVVGNDELFKDVYSQLIVNIVTNSIMFLLIALFYFIAYRSEQRISREAQALKISEQQKAYEAELLKLEKTAADSANKAKGDFLAQMSHEIRTPINAVLGMNEMILRESNDQSILEYADNIQTAGKTLLSLINSILDFSKIEDGKMEIIPVTYDTISMIHNLMNSVSERAKAKGLTFTLHADPELPCRLVGDDVRVSQVIVNLLINAVKYTDTGSVTLEMRCKERSENHILLAVAVRDTGIGIRKEDMEKLFETFSRLDETRNRHIEGTGLGMAIVTKLLALMGSKLEVESVYGEGSVFSFELQQEIADAYPIGTDLERRSDPDSRKNKQYPQFPGARVLVTDDNDMNLKVAGNLLKLFGIVPDLALSGMQTIDRMQKNTYDIVFLDHMMPKMDGIETLEKLREKQLIPPETAMIVLTANAVIGAKEKYLAAGFQDYLSKPINLDQLCGKLSAFLSGKLPVPAAPEEDDEVMEFLPVSECQSPPEPEPPDFSEALTEAGFSAESGLRYCAGDLAFYRELLTDYANSYQKRMEELDTAWDAGDLKQYQTLVHSLKSISGTIGADDVSALAKLLEEAAKNGDTGYIAAHHRALAELFGKRTDALKTLFALP